MPNSNSQRFLLIIKSPWVRAGFAALVLCALIFFNRIEFEVFERLSDTWRWLVLALFLMMPTYAIVSLRFWLVLRNQGIDCGLPLAIRWTMIGSFFDLAMPSNSGGDIVKAGYLYNYLDAGQRTSGVMAIGFDRVLGVIGLFLLATTSSLIGWNVISDLPGGSGLLLLLISACFVPLFFFRLIGSRRLASSTWFSKIISRLPFGERIAGVIVCFRHLREAPLQFVSVLALSVLNHIFWCAALFCIIQAFSESVTLIDGFIVFPVAIFSNIFGYAGGFGVGTAAFDIVFSNLLGIQVGASIGLTFQTLSAISRLAGLPFYLKPTG